MLIQINRLQYDRKTNNYMKDNTNLIFYEKIDLARFFETNKEKIIEIEKKNSKVKNKLVKLKNELYDLTGPLMKGGKMGLIETLENLKELIHAQKSYQKNDSKRYIKEFIGLPLDLKALDKRIAKLENTKNEKENKIKKKEKYISKCFNPFTGMNYILKGVIMHQGDAEQGHYFSYNKLGENWFIMDDSKVTKVDREQVLLDGFGKIFEDRGAYCLVYEEESFNKNLSDISAILGEELRSFIDDSDANLLQLLVKDEMSDFYKKFKIKLENINPKASQPKFGLPRFDTFENYIIDQMNKKGKEQIRAIYNVLMLEESLKEFCKKQEKFKIELSYLNQNENEETFKELKKQIKENTITIPVEDKEIEKLKDDIMFERKKYKNYLKSILMLTKAFDYLRKGSTYYIDFAETLNLYLNKAFHKNKELECFLLEIFEQELDEILKTKERIQKSFINSCYFILIRKNCKRESLDNLLKYMKDNIDILKNRKLFNKFRRLKKGNFNRNEKWKGLEAFEKRNSFEREEKEIIKEVGGTWSLINTGNIIR